MNITTRVDPDQLAAVLTRARKLIADPDQWCINVSAEDDEGCEVNPLSPEACRWCAVGAVTATTRDRVLEVEAHELLRHVAYALWGVSATVVNDGLGHDEAIELYDSAITVARVAHRADTL